MAQAGFTPISLYFSTTAAAAPTAGNLVNGELAINITDGKLYYKDNAGVVKLLASNSGSSGDVVGPASATDNAIARFDGTTGKLIQNSAVTIGDTGNTVIEVTDNSNAALRITQLGTGNALLVEDATNPDSTPFVVDNNGNVGIGLTNPGTYTSSGMVLQSASSSAPAIFNWNTTNDTSRSSFGFRKDRSGAIVQSGDNLGLLRWQGYDGASFLTAGQIDVGIDGTPGTNDMPGRLVFSTTADGASTPTERMRIDSAGRVAIGSSGTSAGTNVRLNLPLTGATTVNGYSNTGGVQSDVTNAAIYFNSGPSTAASAFTLTGLYHYFASQGTIGAGSTVTNQYGYFAQSTLTGATNNFGFYSNIASGTGRWNFYANGTAANYFAGLTTIGSALQETRVAIGASNIDLSLGNYFTRTISGTTTLTVSNVPTTGTAASFILDLTNGGSATVNWWSGVKWAGGTAPTLTAAGRDALGFYTYDGGTTWTGLVLGKDIK